MSIIDEEDCENIFASNGSSSDGNESEIKVESRQISQRRTLMPLINNSNRTLILGNADKDIDGNCASNSSDKIKIFPLRDHKTDLGSSPGIKRKSRFVKNENSVKRNLFISGERRIRSELWTKTSLNDCSIGRVEGSSFLTGAGNQMLTNNNIKTWKEKSQNLSHARKLGKLIDERSTFVSDENDSLFKTQTLSSVQKIASFIDEIRTYESDEDDTDDGENGNTILDIAEMTFSGAENHLINKTSVDENRTSSESVERLASGKVEKLLLKGKSWDQISFLAEEDNLLIPVDDLINMSGLPDLIPDINCLNLSGKISDHLQFSGWSISHLSLRAASQVLQTQATCPRTPHKVMNQLLGVSQVNVERIDMESLDPSKNVDHHHKETITTKSKSLAMFTPFKQNVDMNVGILWELSSSQFGEQFVLRLKTAVEMKKGVVGHKSRRMRKRPTKYSPSTYCEGSGILCKVVKKY